MELEIGENKGHMWLNRPIPSFFSILSPAFVRVIIGCEIIPRIVTATPLPVTPRFQAPK